MRQLQAILGTMDVPQARTDLTRMANLRWLMRNLPASNAAHPELVEALRLVRVLIKKSQ